MDLKSITNNLKDTSDYHLEQRFEELMRKNPNLKNLDEKNKELIMDIVKKYKQKLRDHAYPTAYTIKEDMYHIYQNRIKLGLTYTDLDQIRDLLQSFKQ